MFHASADNIDDLMRAVFTRLLSANRDNNRVEATKGTSTEVFGALLRLTDPRGRLGRSVARVSASVIQWRYVRFPFEAPNSRRSASDPMSAVHDQGPSSS